MFLIYTRVSTLEQAEDNRTSLQEQERVCRGVAMARGFSGMDIVCYSDPGQSGAAPLKFRPDGKKLVNDMQSGDFVCAAKLDRMFRSAGDALQMIETFREADVRLILPEMGLDPVTDNGPGKLFFGILSLVADFERTTINDRMRSGKAAKKAKGGHTGGEAAYGLRIIGHGRDSKIEVDEREQEIVALITRLRKRGESTRRIQFRLNKDGFKTRTGKEFQHIQIKRIIDRARAN
jgi:DNA invertase Pin-like site-specific DNA recombinase